MKKTMLSFVILACLAGLQMQTGCASSKFGGAYQETIPPEIQKLVDSQYSQAVTAVGTDEGPTEGIAERKAEMQARAELARRFKAQVDELQKSYEESTSDKASQEYQQALEIFASLELVGSQKIKSLVRMQNNGVYQAKVLMVLSAGQLKQLFDEKMAAVTAFKASKAYEELEARVAKEKEASPAGN
jgi:hypothetical protein